MTQQLSSSAKAGAICAAVFAMTLALGTVAAGAATTPPKRIADKGAITYCMDISFPPLESYDPQTNKPVGFDVDLGAALASEMGVKSDFKNITFDGLIPAIQAGQCDAIISGLFDKPKRREVLDFVDYAFLGNSVIVKSDSSLHVDSLAGLSGKTVATQTGTQLEQDLVQANADLAKAGKPPIKITLFPKMTAAFQQLMTGLVDAFYSSTIQAVYYNEQNPNSVKLASPQTSGLYIGVATIKSDADLHAAFDAAFKNLVANGGYDAIVKKWGMGSAAKHP